MKLKSLGEVRSKRPWLYAGLFLLTAALRLTAMDWGLPEPGSPEGFHPDEQAGLSTVTNVVRDRGALTDYAVFRGTGYFLTCGLVAGAADAVGLLHLEEARSPDKPEARRHAYIAARLVTVAFSIGTVFLTLFCGLHLLRFPFALLAAILVAVSPISVVDAHFFKADSSQAFWVMATLLAALKSRADRRWLLVASLCAGITAAFKYPGASVAILVAVAALALDRGDLRRRFSMALVGVPIAAVGFLLFFPQAILSPLTYWRGFMAILQTNVSPGGGLSPLTRILEYPLYSMKAVGPLVPVLAVASVVFNLVRRDLRATLILAWVIPYYLAVSMNSMVLLRYMVPLVPAVALLSARMFQEVGGIRLAGRHRWLLPLLVGLSLFGTGAVSVVHLHTMTRPDPRQLAAAWLEANVPPGSTIAVTPSHPGDVHFTVPVDETTFSRLDLDLQSDSDPSGYLSREFDVLATNEKAWRMPGMHPPDSHRTFWSRVMDSGEFELAARFNNRPHIPLLLWGDLPEDSYYLYQEIRIYRPVQALPNRGIESVPKGLHHVGMIQEQLDPTTGGPGGLVPGLLRRIEEVPTEVILPL